MTSSFEDRDDWCSQNRENPGAAARHARVRAAEMKDSGDAVVTASWIRDCPRRWEEVRMERKRGKGRSTRSSTPSPQAYVLQVLRKWWATAS